MIKHEIAKLLLYFKYNYVKSVQEAKIKKCYIFAILMKKEKNEKMGYNYDYIFAVSGIT